LDRTVGCAGKWTVTVERLADIPMIMKKAFAIAQSGTPGPVFVEFPINTLYPCVTACLVTLYTSCSHTVC
jgi:thiamine pyrophosphate-dependent acetolactate synthase large subunit-like protein